MENLHVISVSDTVTCCQIPKSFTLTNSCWCLSNNGFFCWTNIWLSQCNCNLSNYKLIPKNFRGAAVLYQQSYETHTLGADQIVELILLINPPKQWTENEDNSKCRNTNRNENMTTAVEIHLKQLQIKPPPAPPSPQKKKERKKERNSVLALQLDSNSWLLISEPDTIPVHY